MTTNSTDKKTDIFMPLYWGDYFKSTQHLSTEEHGAYLLLIGHYWNNGKIKNDKKNLQNISKISYKKLLKNVLSFFSEIDGYLIHNRIEHELVKSLKLKQLKAEAGKKGMEARWGKGDNTAIADAITEPITKDNPSPTPSPTLKESKYYYEGKVIKLLEKDYKIWQDNYKNIDLSKELQALDDYYFEHKVDKWFSRCSSALSNKNKKAPPKAQSFSITGISIEELYG